jgi:hypothetical protein
LLIFQLDLPKKFSSKIQAWAISLYLSLIYILLSISYTNLVRRALILELFCKKGSCFRSSFLNDFFSCPNFLVNFRSIIWLFQKKLMRLCSLVTQWADLLKVRRALNGDSILDTLLETYLWEISKFYYILRTLLISY